MPPTLYASDLNDGRKSIGGCVCKFSSFFVRIEKSISRLKPKLGKWRKCRNDSIHKPVHWSTRRAIDTRCASWFSVMLIETYSNPKTYTVTTSVNTQDVQRDDRVLSILIFLCWPKQGYLSLSLYDKLEERSTVPVAVLWKKYFGAWPLIIWEATTARRNYYRTKKIEKWGELWSLAPT